MDQRAQISAEYILLVAMIFSIVLIFSYTIINENEQNNIATAVKLGAVNATANIVLTNNTQSPVKVTSIDMSNVNKKGSDINVIIHFSRNINDQSIIIFNSIIKSLNSSGFNNITSNNTNIIVTTSSSSGISHRYIITLT